MSLPAAVADALEGGILTGAPVEGPAAAPAVTGAAAELGSDVDAEPPVPTLAGRGDSGAAGSH